jgi:hypothetical protein
MSMPYGREQRAIRERAFAIWEHEGRPSGKNLVHWLKAEAEIKLEKGFGPMIRKNLADRDAGAGMPEISAIAEAHAQVEPHQLM